MGGARTERLRRPATLDALLLLRGGEACFGNTVGRVTHVGQVMRWLNFTESGSLPCSPQMPSLLPGRVALPFSQAIFTSWLTPVWSIEVKEFFYTISFLKYTPNNRFKTHK